MKRLLPMFRDRQRVFACGSSLSDHRRREPSPDADFGGLDRLRAGGLL